MSSGSAVSWAVHPAMSRGITAARCRGGNCWIAVRKTSSSVSLARPRRRVGVFLLVRGGGVGQLVVGEGRQPGQARGRGPSPQPMPGTGSWVLGRRLCLRRKSSQALWRLGGHEGGGATADVSYSVVFGAETAHSYDESAGCHESQVGSS